MKTINIKASSRKELFSNLEEDCKSIKKDGGILININTFYNEIDEFHYGFIHYYSK